MEYLVIAFNLTLFLVLSGMLSRTFHYQGLKRKSARILHKLHLTADALNYSLDHLIYFVPVPCHNPLFKNIKREHLFIKKDYATLLFGQVTGVQIYAKINTGDSYLVAYMSVDKMGFPQLAEFQMNGVLTPEEATIINAYKTTSPDTMNDILDEVYRSISSQPQ